jgi:hypothetical protein
MWEVEEAPEVIERDHERPTCSLEYFAIAS